MKKYINYLLALATLFSFPHLTFAQDIHKVGTSMSFNTEQSSQIGWSAYYQWQFSDSFELDIGYRFSNKIAVEHKGEQVSGEFDHVLFGSNYIKQLNQRWDFKAGAGIAFVSNSKNDSLIAGESIAPYLKMNINYHVNRCIDLEFGTMSFFQSDLLGTNHSVFLGVSYLFGDAI